MLGIIGGLGPLPTARLYLSLTSRALAAGRGLPALHIASVPVAREIEDAFVAGRVDALMLARIEALLADALAQLERAGATRVAMPCNTLQELLGRLCAARGLVLHDLLDATADAVALAGVRRVLVLATTATCRGDLYGARLRRRGVEVRYPEPGQQTIVNACIRALLDQREAPTLASVLRGHAGEVEGVVLGCTDLRREELGAAEGLRIFDSVECLAASIERASMSVNVGASAPTQELRP